MNTRKVGNTAEKLARQFLEGESMTFLEKNYNTPYGEADIIMKDGAEFVFVEVKARKSLKYGAPAEAVNKKKKLRYLQIAQYFFMDNGINDYAVRFDIVEVFIAEKTHVNHIRNAYDFTDIADYY